MSEAFDRFIDYLRAERNASPYTLRNYGADLTDFFSFLRKEHIESLDTVDKNTLRDFLGLLMDRGLARTSIARKLSAVRSFYRYLQREELVSVSPAATISSPKLDRKLPTFLTRDESTRLVESPDLSTPAGLRDRAFLELLYASGLRVSELVSLDLGQVNLETTNPPVMLQLHGPRIITRPERDKLNDLRQVTFNRGVNKRRPDAVHMPDWWNAFIGIAEHFRNEPG